MTESVIFIKERMDNVMQTYITMFGGEACIDDEENIIDDFFFEEHGDWTQITSGEGEAMGEDFLLEFAHGKKAIYYYWDDSLLDCEFLVINENNFIRKRFLYSTTPELNEDEGKLNCECNEFVEWSDIDYFIDIITDNPDSLF